MEVGFNQGLVGNVDFVSFLFKAGKQVFGEADRDGAGSGFEIGERNRLSVAGFVIVSQVDLGPKVSFFVLIFEFG